MPKYKCTKGNCHFATDDLDAYLDHREEHGAKEKPAEEETPRAPPKRHQSVDDFLDCPECRPRFDKRYLKEGWTPPKKEPEKQERKEEKSKKRFPF